MTQTHYLRPIALAESPQSEEGEAVRLAGGMVYASRFALKNRIQRRYQRGGRRIGHRNDKGGVRRLGVELIRGQCPFKVLQRLANHRPQRLRARRGLHALPLAHQQLVPQHLTQAAHGVADGRLGNAELVRSARQAALGHDFIKDTQQVEVE